MKYKLVNKSGKYLIKVKQNEELVVAVFSKKGEIDLKVELVGEGAKVRVLGIVVSRGDEKIRVRTETVHKKPNTHAETMVYGVVEANGLVELLGMIKIKKQANRVTDFLTERVLLLSQDSKAVVEPELEIEANEVRASHAATISKIDDEQLFYLTSRGIAKGQAEKEIVKGFLKSVAEKIKDDKIRKQIEKEVYV